ncbi:hypothetical protein D3C81_1151120 [compost metagenome]
MAMTEKINSIIVAAKLLGYRIEYPANGRSIIKVFSETNAKSITITSMQNGTYKTWKNDYGTYEEDNMLTLNEAIKAFLEWL